MSGNIEQLKAAQAQLIEAEKELAAAQQALENWIHRDLEREDGSAAQDRRHEEIGQHCRQCVREAAAKVEALKKLIASLS